MIGTRALVEPRVKSDISRRNPSAAAFRRWAARAAVVAVAAVALSACAAGREFRAGEKAAQAGNWDEAVSYYRRALQAAPDNPKCHIALERAMNNAARIHLDQAQAYDLKDELDLALREYRKVVEYDGSNRTAGARVQELEKTIRDRIEASRPRPKIDTMRDQARRSRVEPVLSPTSREPIEWDFRDQPLKLVFTFISESTGINILYDSTYPTTDRTYSVKLKDVTLEQALQAITVANNLFYKVLNEHTIIIVPDNQTKRTAYEEQAIQTFVVSHADVDQLQALITSILRVQLPVQPAVAANKLSNTITARASLPVLDIIERIIEANDKPRAEIVVDVEILEINRNRAKQYGLDLSAYAVNLLFSPESSPAGTSGGTPGAGGATSGTAAAGTFNLNTISKGVSTADFYASVPSAVMRFLESDSETKVIAKPQLRGTEGEKLTLNLGDDIPVPSTTFAPVAAGGAAFNPMTSFQYRPVGVIVEMEPRVTYEGDIRIKLSVESSALGRDVNISGQNLPSFGSRKVQTVLRLRDGESNLLAGLLREDERRSLSGFPGAIHTPVLKELFSANDRQVAQTDIVMLLTPRIVRSHELTQRDLNPVYIGTQSTMGMSGPPPVISSTSEPPVEAPPSAAGQAKPAQPGSPVPTVPGGTAQIPGTIPVAPPAAGGAPPAQQAQPATPPGAAQQAQPTTPPATPPAGEVVNPPPAGAAAAPPKPAAGAPPAGGAVPPAATGAAAAPPKPAAPPPSPAVTAKEAAEAGRTVVSATVSPSEWMMAGGPYNVPISIENASRLSTMALTVSFNPAYVKVRLIQEGSFMRQGGVTVAFNQRVDAKLGRVDISVVRNADKVGASGSGIIGSLIFDAIAPGTSPISVSGVASSVGGAVMQVRFVAASVVVR